MREREAGQLSHTPELDDEWLDRHWKHLTPAELDVLRLRAIGDEDAAIMEALAVSYPALRSRLRRFSDRTGITHVRLVAWAQRHSVRTTNA